MSPSEQQSWLRARAACEALAQALLARGDLLFNLPDYPRARQAFDELLAIREAMAKAKSGKGGSKKKA